MKSENEPVNRRRERARTDPSPVGVLVCGLASPGSRVASDYDTAVKAEREDRGLGGGRGCNAVSWSCLWTGPGMGEGPSIVVVGGW